MTEGEEESPNSGNMYYAEDNPYTTDLFARPDLFYGNPGDNLNLSNERYPNALYFNESVGYNEYPGWEGELTNSAEIQGMVSVHRYLNELPNVYY